MLQIRQRDLYPWPIHEEGCEPWQYRPVDHQGRTHPSRQSRGGTIRCCVIRCYVVCSIIHFVTRYKEVCLYVNACHKTLKKYDENNHYQSKAKRSNDAWVQKRQTSLAKCCILTISSRLSLSLTHTHTQTKQLAISRNALTNSEFSSLTCSANIRFSSSSMPTSGQLPYTCV